MLKIRRPLGRLIFNMGIAIPGKTVFLIETAPREFTKWGDQHHTLSAYTDFLGRLSFEFRSRACLCTGIGSLHWGHNGRDGVSNHQPHDCVLSRLFNSQIKENIKAPRHWLLCGEFTVTDEFPAQRASNAEKFPFDDVIMFALFIILVY